VALFRTSPATAPMHGVAKPVPELEH
jgi:hypothetical protein